MADTPTYEATNAALTDPRAFLTLAVAKAMTLAAQKKAEEIKVPMYISVVDWGANLISINRMENAILISEQISIDKAHTAMSLKMPTHVLAGAAQPGADLFGIAACKQTIIFGGGFPIILNGQFIGGIGVSGGSVEEDMAVATAGLQKFKELADAAKDAIAFNHSGEKAEADLYGPNLAISREIAEAVEKKALEIGVPMYCSVVDAAANLILTHRMEGAILVSCAISQDKAYSAVALKGPTEGLAAVSQPGASLYGLQQCHRIIIFGGGIPLYIGGKVVGAVGVSGGSVEEDITCCTAGIDVFKKYYK